MLNVFPRSIYSEIYDYYCRSYLEVNDFTVGFSIDIIITEMIWNIANVFMKQLFNHIQIFVNLKKISIFLKYVVLSK